jgi:exopolyphosphatase / guanosine-5'-triphosphate,3'-diphosphate pyrophosphatase
MNETAAAIDVGSHTARLLIARRSSASSWGWAPLRRHRAYIRLAADNGPGGGSKIGPDATARTVKVLRDFSRIMAECGVERIHAIATGVIRDAIHSDRFLSHLYEETGILIKLISGQHEALLSARGARAVLNIRGDALVFDLGGGTTEFLRDRGGAQTAISLPFGAAVLTGRYLRSDPPAPGDLKALAGEVEQHLAIAETDISGTAPILGTGGTVTALAAMVHGISQDHIAPEGLNGLVLTLTQLDACLGQMKTLTTDQRVARLGLDRGRADVLPAGTLAVTQIMRFLGASDIRVSMSDLLEGLLIE